METRQEIEACEARKEGCAVAVSILDGFEVVERSKMHENGWAKIACCFYESGEDCMRRQFPDIEECNRARIGIGAAVRRLKLPVGVHRRKECLYLTREVADGD